MKLQAIKWFGGKGRMLIKILPLMSDIPHERYIEVFGGGCSLLLNKPIKPFECYNDIDNGLYNFFSVLSDPDLFDQFYRRVGLLPYCRQLYLDCREGWNTENDPVKRAAMWYVVARQSFGGDFGHSWGSVTTSIGGGMPMTNQTWLSSLKKLPFIHERLQRVQIENSDFRDILERYDGKDALFYLDPPYVADTRSAGQYKHETTDQDHRDMVDILLSIEGNAIVSGYDSNIYNPLIEAGWKKVEFDVACFAAGRTKTSGLQGKGAIIDKQKRTECAWIKPHGIAGGLF